ncbi:ABC transporter ATP-binding protein [Stagnimonas aquatica]|uniref:ABC transporter ATP-binding protein n=1 Tax=Stagnimonas aquatica TaxID=2689987 RepID=A0A3N0VK01_9GAMM|nr:ABC transporter ATP-binding protein [Stagnimonas aquatica]ROH93021.1 ABC transporter ATP-binding protein [Stagnimonas aquatica]
MALIELDGIVRSYRLGGEDFQALRGVSLRVEAGEFVAIMGQSGSGKSTLMNILGCLDTPSAGEYRLAGERVSALPAARLAQLRSRLIGFVFQNFNLLPRVSALDNVALPLAYARVPRKERLRRAQEALERVGLAEKLRNTPSQLSGGQQQRVAIARALVTRPQVLFADEPTGNLDSTTSVAVIALLQQLWQAGQTIVMVTHEPDIAAHAARVITLRDGQVLSDVRQQALLIASGAPA